MITMLVLPDPVNYFIYHRLLGCSTLIGWFDVFSSKNY